MKIVLSGIFLGLLLMVVPLYIDYRFRLHLTQKLATSIGRLAFLVAVMALVVYGGVMIDSVVYDIAMGLLFCVFATWMTLYKARLKPKLLFLPLLGGNVVAVGVVSVYVLLLVMKTDNMLTASLFLSMMILLSGGVIMSNAKALGAFFSGLRNHGQLYYYLLGNGESHRQAISYFVRRSLRIAMVVEMRRLSYVVLFVSPVLFCGMVMAGADVLTAAPMQVLLAVMLMAASLLAVCFTLVVGRKNFFDEYNRLKVRDAKASDQPASDRPVSDSSASPSVPRGIDPENPQQEA